MKDQISLAREVFAMAIAQTLKLKPNIEKIILTEKRKNFFYCVYEDESGCMQGYFLYISDQLISVQVTLIYDKESACYKLSKKFLYFRKKRQKRLPTKIIIAEDSE